LVAIVAITLGPDYIGRNNCNDLYPIIKQQKSEIASLNQEILVVQRECTRNSIDREKEIREIVLQLEGQINLVSNLQSRRVLMKTSYHDTVSFNGDSIRLVEKIQVQQNPMDMSGIKKSLSCLKEKIKQK
jgi:hypothetical protein